MSTLHGSPGLFDADRPVALPATEDPGALSALLAECGEADTSTTAPLRAVVLPTPLGPMLAVASDSALVMLEFTDRRAMPAQRVSIKRWWGAPIVAMTEGYIAGHPVLGLIRGEIDAYFAGALREFHTPIDPRGTPFQQLVWAELVRIPFGRRRSYADVAGAIGRPDSVRAVANANGDNRLGIVVPCHRVIGSDGSLTGYGGGLERKAWLLRHESGLR